MRTKNIKIESYRFVYFLSNLKYLLRKLVSSLKNYTVCYKL